MTETFRTPQRTIRSVREAQRAYPEDLPDYRFVEPYAKQLWQLRYKAGPGGDGFVCRDDAWTYLLSPREQLSFTCYLAVKTGLCPYRDLQLERFADQGVAVAVELLLTERERAIALSPIANRVRLVQLTVVADTPWDVLALPSWQREDRLEMLA